MDASAVPLDFRGNTVSLTNAFAEKAADTVKQDVNRTAPEIGGGPQPFVNSAYDVAVDRFLLLLLACNYFLLVL